MSEEISKIARVYQFLSENKNWQEAADLNGDSIITKGEARSYFLENFNWAGTDPETARKDLFNKFWATIDTKRSGRIAGSTKSNLDALDKNEIDKMQEKIEMYDMAIEFANQLTPPDGAQINDYSAWMKKVKESILTRVEKYIKNGGKLENLQEFLEAQGQEAVVITTADMIAQDLIKEKVGNIPNYGGYDGDEDLHRIIDNYVNSLKQNPNVSGAEISETITRLVNAYVSTLDGMPSESDIELLKQYGYPITEKSGLNDLQKAVLNNSLTEKLAKIKVGDDYDKYPELFDKAIEEFIKSLLEGTKMSDFATVKNYGIPEFEASEAYKNLKTKLQVSKFFSSDTFKNKLKEVLGETISEKVGGKWSGELPALDEIITVALDNAEKGAFGNPIDENKLAEWAIKQIEEKIKDFFPDGFKDLSLTQMTDAYNGVEKAAQDTQNIETLRFGATSYCDALIARNNSAFKNAVIDLFGENYAEKIKTLSSTEISKLMAELIAKIDELGDATTFSIDEKNAIWNGIPANVSLYSGDTNDKLQIGRSLKIGDRTISSDRIRYSSTGNSDILHVNEETGAITITGKTPGDYEVTLNVLVDGIKIGSKKITVTVMKCKETIDFNSVGIQPGTTVPISGSISGKDTFSNDLRGAKSSDINVFSGYIDGIYKKLQNIEGLNKDALATAANNMKALYTQMIDAMYEQCANTERAKKGCYQKVGITYNGESYSAEFDQDDDLHEKGGYSKAVTSIFGVKSEQSAEQNQLGLHLYVHTDNPRKYWIELNMQCFMDMFQKFYQAALGQ